MSGSSSAPPAAQPTPEEGRWIRLRDALIATPLSDINNGPVLPPNTSTHIVPAIDIAYNAGFLTGTGVPTTYTPELPLFAPAFGSQRLYYQNGLQNGTRQRLAALAPAPAPGQQTGSATGPTPRRKAPKLNPPKPFDGTRSEYRSFMTQLTLIFKSDPDQFQDHETKIAYAASYLVGSAKEWFQPHINETTGDIAFPTWAAFTAALKAAFDDPDAYQTAQRKIEALKQGQQQDCSSYHAAFVPLATILNMDERTRISFFQRGLQNELRKALSYRDTLPDTFDAFVQMCIRIDNRIRAHRESNPIRTQGGQFAPNTNNNVIPSTSTGTHPGPMDLSAAGRNRSQKRGPITEAEKKRRRENHLCLYCGSPGHWASQCPHKKTKGKPTASTALIDVSAIPALPISPPVSPAQILYEPKN